VLSDTDRQWSVSTTGGLAMLTIDSKRRVRHPDGYPWSTTLEVMLGMLRCGQISGARPYVPSDFTDAAITRSR